MNSYLRSLLFVCAFFSVGTVKAMPIGYGFEWTGNNGYTMTGMFTGEDTNMDDFIRDSEVISLSFEGFLNGVSIGATSGDPVTLASVRNFDFNFNLIDQLFVQGASCFSGQCWNLRGAGLGFVQGSGASHFSLDGSNVLDSLVNNNVTYAYSVTPAAQVPSPSPSLLLGAGLLAMGFAKRKRILHKK